MDAVAPSPLTAGAFSHSFRVGARLVWNDAKQGLRKHLAGNTRRDKWLRGGGGLFGLAFLAGLHFAAFALFSCTWLSPSKDKAALIAGLSTSIWSFLLFVMLSGGLVRALVVLHEQDDSSLLLSSPVSPRAILAARLFGNALQSCLVDGFIIVPYINIRIFVLGLHLNFLWATRSGLRWRSSSPASTAFFFRPDPLAGLAARALFSQAVPFILIFAVTFFAGTLSVSVAQLSADQAHMPPGMQAHFIALSHTPLVGMAYARRGKSGPASRRFFFTALRVCGRLRSC